MQDASGAYPASPTFAPYAGFCWFRDGSFIADGVSAYGGVDSASAFFDWCTRVLVARTDQIAGIDASTPDDGMLPGRFTFDGVEQDDGWWDFQLDGFGTWLWAVAEHAARHDLTLDRWMPGITLSVDYLLASWSRPCFDWWEENATEVHVSTLGCIAAGLRAVAPVDARASAAADSILSLIATHGTVDGRLTKWLRSTAVDASLVALVAPLGLFPATSPVGAATLAAVESQLVVDGGAHRYLADTFYGGGQWPLLSCFVGLGELANGDPGRAAELLAFAAGTASADASMPEQVKDHLLAPEMVAEWEERWGPSALPLLWTHAMFLRLAVDSGAVEPLR